MSDEDSQSRGVPGPAFGALKAVVAGGLLVYVGYTVKSQWAAAGPVPFPSVGWLAASVATLILYYAMILENWRSVMAALGARLARGAAFRIVFVANLAKFLPGGIWNLVGRVALCRAAGVPVAAATVSVVVELTAQVAAMAAMAVVGWSGAVEPLLPFGRSAMLPLVGLVVAGTHPRMVNGVLATAERLTGRSFPRMEIRYRAMLGLLVRYMGAWAVLCVAFALFGRALGGAMAVGTFEAALRHVGAISVSWLAGLLAFVVPGGLGVREVLLTKLLEGVHPVALAATLALAFRLALVMVEVAAFVAAIVLGGPVGVRLADGEGRR
ncbi:MAG: lysylphosphatidylglycerol synthase domain-containing protein [Myxococcota bacterium]